MFRRPIHIGGMQVEVLIFAAVVVVGAVVLFPPLFGSMQAGKVLAAVCGAGMLLLGAALKSKYGDENTLKAGVISFAIIIFASTLLSHAPIASFFGSAVLEQGSGAFLLTLLGTVYASAVLFRNTRARCLLMYALLILAGAVCMFTIADFFILQILIMKGETLLGNIRTVEMVAWLGLLAWVHVRAFLLSHEARFFLNLSALFCAFFIFIFGMFDALSYLGIGFLLAIFAYRSFLPEPSTKRKLYAALFVLTLVLSVLAVSARSLGILPLNAFPAEISPTLNASANMIPHVLLKDVRTFLFGVGPGQFSAAWELARTKELNQSLLWEETFRTAFNTYITRLIETGALGALFASAAFLACVLSLCRRSVLGESRYYFAAFLTYGGLWFLTSVPDASAEFLYAVLAGSFLGAVYFGEERQERTRLKAVSLIIGSVAFLSLGVLYAVSFTLYSVGLSAFENGHVQEGTALLRRASTIAPSGMFAETLARVHQGLIDRAVRIQESSPEGILDSVKEAERSAKRAMFLNPNSLSSALLYGDLLTMHALLSSNQSLLIEAKEAYKTAASLSPLHPVPHLRAGQVSLQAGERGEAVDFARAALRRKPGYEPAEAFLQALRQGQ